jgi:hypothetical protein
MARYVLRLKTQGEPDRTVDFDAGRHAYVKGDIVDLAEDGLWRAEKLGPLDEPFLAELTCISFRARLSGNRLRTYWSNPALQAEREPFRSQRRPRKLQIRVGSP